MGSIEEWSDFFAQAGFDETTAYTLAEKFTKENIRKENLETISDKDLEQLGIRQLGYRRLIQFHIWRETNQITAAVEVLKSNEASGDDFETSKLVRKKNMSAGSGNSSIKKKTYVDEFLEVVRKQDIREVIAKGGEIIQKLENDLRARKRYKLLLSVRWRIEILEVFLKVPDSDPVLGECITNREERWIAFFKRTTDPFVKQMGKKIEEHGSTVKLFCKAVRVLSGDFSDPVAHRIAMPDEITEGDIDNVLELIGVKGDLAVKATIKILSEPIKECVNEKDER